MPEFEVHLLVGSCEENAVLLKRTIVAPFLPRVGEDVLIGRDGWSESVRTVWHDFIGPVVVEIGRSQGVVDAQGEGLVEAAREAGWS